ncbi:MAG: DUF4058 family protein [Gemmataceae bacterium]
MPSPFPGMNPYLEHAGAWRNFHSLFPGEASRRLNRVIGPKYYVVSEEHVYVREPLEGGPARPRSPDLFASEMPTGEVSSEGTVAVLGPQLRVEEVELPEVDEERVPFVEIRDVYDNRVVTVIELLSPTNKRAGNERQKYLTKRAEVLASSASLVEIDLLRGGRRMPLSGRVSGTYGVLVSRPESRPKAEWVAINLRERLPVLPIPLGEGDTAVTLDLQEVLHTLYDDHGFAKFIYRKPPDPPLAAEDAAWAHDILAAAGITAVAPSL